MLNSAVMIDTNLHRHDKYNVVEKKSLKIPKSYLDVNRRRRIHCQIKDKKINKTLYRKLKTEQYEFYHKPGVKSRAPEE